MMTQDEFTTFEATKIVGVKWGKFKGSLDAGFIQPTRTIPWDKRGGEKSFFSLNQLYFLKLFFIMGSMGFPRGDACNWIETLKNNAQTIRPKIDIWAADFIVITFSEYGFEDGAFVMGKDITIRAKDKPHNKLILSVERLKRSVNFGIEKVRGG